MRTGRKAIITLAVLAALALTARAHALDDVLGWQSVRWGMTEAEVRGAAASLGLQVLPAAAPGARSFGTNVPFQTTTEIAGHSYDVSFQFLDQTRRLVKVVVADFDPSRERALARHRSLSSALTERYGPPTEVETPVGLLSVSRWTFKTTTIVLRIHTDTAARGHHLSEVSLTYSPTVASTPKGRKEKLLSLGLLKLLGEGWRP